MHTRSRRWKLEAVAVWTLVVMGCATSQYTTPPQGPDEQAVARVFEVYIKGWQSRDWQSTMAVVADDIRVEWPGQPPEVGKTAYGERIRESIAKTQRYTVKDIRLVLVSPTRAQITSTSRREVAGKAPATSAWLFEFEKRGARWLLVKKRNLWYREGNMAPREGRWG